MSLKITFLELLITLFMYFLYICHNKLCTYYNMYIYKIVFIILERKYFWGSSISSTSLPIKKS